MEQSGEADRDIGANRVTGSCFQSQWPTKRDSCRTWRRGEEGFSFLQGVIQMWNGVTLQLTLCPQESLPWSSERCRVSAHPVGLANHISNLRPVTMVSLLCSCKPRCFFFTFFFYSSAFRVSFLLTSSFFHTSSCFSPLSGLSVAATLKVSWIFFSFSQKRSFGSSQHSTSGLGNTSGLCLQTV